MTDEQFEAAVTEACEKNLKPEFDPAKYASAALDELYDGYGHGYSEKHFEIRGLHTISGNPVTVTG